MRVISQEYKIAILSGAVESGTGDDVAGDAVDVAGSHGVAFFVELVNDVAGNATLLEGSNTSASEGFAQILGASVPGGSGELVVLELVNPRFRWVRPVVNRAGGAAAISSMVALVRAKLQPAQHGEGVVAVVAVDAPADE